MKHSHRLRPGFWLGFIDFFTAGLFFLVYIPLGGLQREKLFASSASRENLRYSVLFRETEEEKYNTLRNLIARRGCPTIVYVSRTGRSEKPATG